MKGKIIINCNSYICDLIARAPAEWEERLLYDYSVKVKREGRLAIFNYTIESDFSDPVVQEARGIIIDTERLFVVCRPFRKFGNYNERYADSIDWNSARILEKVDGSIVKLWYDGLEERWRFSTNSTISAENAAVDGEEGLTFMALIESADNYGDIPFDRLQKDSTYIFELASPKNRVIVKYENTTLYHIGTRRNASGEERDEDIGIRKPRSYEASSLAECIALAASLNDACEGDEVEREGFVVVDKDFRRVKVKSPDYIMMHRLKQTGVLSKRECITMILDRREKIEGVCRENPDLEHVFRYYEYKLSELRYTARRLALFACRLYEEYSRDRGAVAGVIGKHPLAMVAFRALETGESGDDIFDRLPCEKKIKLIPDYEPVDIRRVFGV